MWQLFNVKVSLMPSSEILYKPDDKVQLGFFRSLSSKFRNGKRVQTVKATHFIDEVGWVEFVEDQPTPEEREAGIEEWKYRLVPQRALRPFHPAVKYPENYCYNPYWEEYLPKEINRHPWGKFKEFVDDLNEFRTMVGKLGVLYGPLSKDFKDLQLGSWVQIIGPSWPSNGGQTRSSLTNYLNQTWIWGEFGQVEALGNDWVKVNGKEYPKIFVVACVPERILPDCVY